MGKSIVSTCMGLPGKTKDNTTDRKDLAELCNSLTLELTEIGGKPHVSLCLKPQQRKEIMRVDEGVELPQWLHCRLEMIRECDNMEAN
jgi:hypothetical protein